MIAHADTVVHPRAMVVHFEHAAPARATMVRFGRLYTLANTALLFYSGLHRFYVLEGETRLLKLFSYGQRRAV